MNQNFTLNHDPEKAERTTDCTPLLETKIMKVIERDFNQIFKVLDPFPTGCKETAAKPLIGRAGQVNIGSQVLNE